MLLRWFLNAFLKESAAVVLISSIDNSKNNPVHKFYLAILLYVHVILYWVTK